MLEIKNLYFGYDDTFVLKGINFSVAKGQNISVIGESGCGKSSLLKVIYGLLQIDEGEILYNGQKLLGPDFHLVPGEEFMKYQAQDFDLMPFITVEENVGKYLSNFYKEEKKRRTYELLELVDMVEFAKIKTRDLSGGQQQRVALAKVLAKEPEILLLDEPFSNIDTFKKNTLRKKLFTYFKEKGITCIVATHDIGDTLAYADEVIVLRNGVIEAKATKEELYNNPPNKYVATLFDDVSEVPVHLLMPFEDKNKKVLVYPHELKETSRSALKVKVKKSLFKGRAFLYEGYFREGKVFFEHQNEIEQGEEIFLDVDRNLVKTRINN